MNEAIAITLEGIAVLSERLRDLVDRVVRAAAPEQIILFGSAARGEARADSDIDPDQPAEWINRARSDLAIAQSGIYGAYRYD